MVAKFLAGRNLRQTVLARKAAVQIIRAGTAWLSKKYTLHIPVIVNKQRMIRSHLIFVALICEIATKLCIIIIIIMSKSKTVNSS